MFDKELQARAITAGLKANAKSADLLKALESMAASATSGKKLVGEVAAAMAGWAPKAPKGVDAEKSEVHTNAASFFFLSRVPRTRSDARMRVCARAD